MRGLAAITVLAALMLPAQAGAVFVPEPPVATGTSPFGVEAGDLNGDGRPDLAVANSGNGTVSVLLRQAQGGFTMENGPISTTGSTTSGPRSVAIADFNGDTRPDLAVLNGTHSNFTILLRNSVNTGYIAEGTPTSVLNGSVQIVAADFNGDAKPDLAVVGTSVVQIFLRQTGTFVQEPGPASPINPGPGTTPLGIAATDFNSDSRPDLAVVLNGTDRVATYLRQPQPPGGFTAESGSPFTVGDSPQAIAAGDFNADGRPDLVVPAANSMRTTTVLLRQAGGGFAPASGVPNALAFPTDAATGDFNADGRVDYAVSESDNDRVEVFLNKFGGGFAADPSSPVPAGPSPQSVAIADFDTDNLPDIAVADANGGGITVLHNVTAVTSPDTTIGDGPGELTADTTPAFTFSSTSGGATFECRVDGGAFAACTSPHTTGVLSDGRHTFEVRARTGPTVDPTPAARTFTVDTTAPDTVIAGGPSGSTTERQPTFAFGSTEEHSSFECRVDGAAFAPCASAFTAAALGVGPHTFEVRATDAAGNTDASPAARAFTVVDPPVPVFTVKPNPTCVGSTTRFDATGSSPGSAPITRYRFDYDERQRTTTGTFTTAHVVIADGTSATATHVFDWNVNYLGGSGRGSGGADRIVAAGSTIAQRDDADVVLTLTDANGITASTTKRVTFAQHGPGARTGCPPLASGAFEPATPLRSARVSSTAVVASIPCRGLLLCAMTVSFDSARARRERVTASRAKRVVIAKGNAVVPAGERKPVKVKLTSAGRRMVKGRKRLSARMKIATLAPNGKRVVRTRSVTLKR